MSLAKSVGTKNMSEIILMAKFWLFLALLVFVLFVWNEYADSHRGSDAVKI